MECGDSPSSLTPWLAFQPVLVNPQGSRSRELSSLADPLLLLRGRDDTVGTRDRVPHPVSRRNTSTKYFTFHLGEWGATLPGSRTLIFLSIFLPSSSSSSFFLLSSSPSSSLSIAFSNPPYSNLLRPFFFLFFTPFFFFFSLSFSGDGGVFADLPRFSSTPNAYPVFTIPSIT